MGFFGGGFKNIFIWVFWVSYFGFFVFYFKFKYQYKKNEWQNWTILFDNKFNLKILSNQTNSRYSLIDKGRQMILQMKQT